jgi:hypothetical protein
VIEWIDYLENRQQNRTAQTAAREHLPMARTPKKPTSHKAGRHRFVYEHSEQQKSAGSHDELDDISSRIEAEWSERCWKQKEATLEPWRRLKAVTSPAELRGWWQDLRNNIATPEIMVESPAFIDYTWLLMRNWADQGGMPPLPPQPNIGDRGLFQATYGFGYNDIVDKTVLLNIAQTIIEWCMLAEAGPPPKGTPALPNITEHVYGITLDHVNRRVRREGYDKEVALFSTQVGWHIFKVTLSAAPEQATRDALESGYPGELTARWTAINALNRKLKRLNLKVRDRTLTSLD